MFLVEAQKSWAALKGLGFALEAGLSFGCYISTICKTLLSFKSQIQMDVNQSILF